MSTREGGATLWLDVITGPGIVPQPFHTLSNDAVTLTHLLDPHQIAVVAITLFAHRNVKVHTVIDLIGLVLA